MYQLRSLVVSTSDSELCIPKSFKHWFLRATPGDVGAWTFCTVCKPWCLSLSYGFLTTWEVEMCSTANRMQFACLMVHIGWCQNSKNEIKTNTKTYYGAIWVLACAVLTPQHAI